MKLFRREWVFPVLVVAFISASARADRDELTAQAATDMHCNSVSVIQSSDTKFLATGCGQDKTYTCSDEGCTLDDDGTSGHAATGDDSGDDAAAEAIAEAIVEAGCACASGAMTSHHSHASHSHSSSHKKKKD